MLNPLYQLSNNLINLLFPKVCNACGGYLFQNEIEVCTKCMYDLPFTDYHLHAENRVAKQLWGRLPFANAMAMLYFNKGGKVQNLLHNLKYNGKTEVGEILGKLLAQKLKENESYQDIDYIIPVPLHKSKLKKRGYNQCTHIAIGLVETLKIPVLENNLIRLQKTESQTKKSRYLRFQNMQKVFDVQDEALLLGKHILLIDDVITTGGTIEACGNALIAAGIGKLSIAGIAFAE